MRQKRKFIIKLLSFGIIFILFSCSEEFYENSINQNNNKKYSINKTTFKKIKDYKMKSFILKSQNKILTNKVFKSTNRSIEDFVIDTTNVMEISDGITKSYTFSIDNNDSTKIENLVTIKQNEEFKSYLVEYDLTSEEMNTFNSSGTITNLTPDYVTDLETESKISTTGPCVLHSYESVLLCYDANGNTIITSGDLGDGCVGQPFDGIIEVYDINLNCNSSGGGGSSDTGGTSTNGGTLSGSSEGGGGTTYSSNNSNTDPNLLTTPVNPIKNFNLVKNPCDVLKKVNNINKSAYINNHNNASYLSACDNCEYGYKFRMASNQNPLLPSQLPTSNGTEIGIPVGLDIYGANHSHPPNTYQMFSFHDINTLFTLYLNAHESIKQYSLFMLNNSNGTDYAILIDDFETFANFINEELTNTGINDCESALNKLENKLDRKYKKSNNLEKTFLNLISSSGISLYSPTDANFSNWQKLSLPTNTSNPVVKTPCN